MMARRAATDVIPLHVYRENPDARGTCLHCPMIKRNPVHVPADDPRVTAQAAAQEEHRRRAGDDG